MRPPRTQPYAAITEPRTDMAAIAENVRLREIDERERQQRRVFLRSRIDTFDVDLTDLEDP